MELALVLIAFLVMFAARIAVRRLVVRRWVEGRLRGRQFVYAFFLTAYAPIFIVLLWFLVQGKAAAVLILLVLLPPLLVLLALVDYAERHGVREHLLSLRDQGQGRQR